MNEHSINQKQEEILFAINTKRISLPLVYFLPDKIMIDIDFLPYEDINEIRIFHKATLVTTGTVEIICQDETFFFQYGKKEEPVVLSAIEMVREKIKAPTPFYRKTSAKNQPSTPEMTFSVADEILKFKHLLDMGAITEEEYEKEKAKLLQ